MLHYTESKLIELSFEHHDVVYTSAAVFSLLLLLLLLLSPLRFVRIKLLYVIDVTIPFRERKASIITTFEVISKAQVSCN